MDNIDGFADSYEMSNTSTTSFFASAPDNTSSSFVCPAEQILKRADVSALQLLSNSLESMFDSASYSDAKLVLADGKEVSFHRCILSARSPLFRKKLAAAVAEKEKEDNSSSVKLELNKIAKDHEVGFDSVVTVLAYVYSSRIRPPSNGVSDCADENCRHEACRPAVDFMLEILYLAFIFEIPELVTMYQRHLLNVLHKIVIEDTLVILKLANICGEACKKLRDRCIEIVVGSDVDRVSLDKSLPQDIVKQILDIRKQLGLVEPELDKHVSNIYKALDSDDIALVEMLLKESYTNLDDAYALHFSVAYCDVKTAQDLLNLELADVNHRNNRGYTVLHIAAMRKEPKLIGSLLTKRANASELSLDGRTALMIAKQVTKAAECIVAETDKPSLKGQGGLCVEILQHADKHDPFPNDVSPSLAVATDELIDLENRVLLAQKIFPNEAQVAMDIAQMKGTSEFIVISLEHDRLTGAKRTSSGLEMTPEEYQTRLNAVSKTVEFAKRFFPRCSAVLDVIMDCEDLTQLACGEEEDTPEKRQQKKKRYMEIQETVKTAFSKDKEELGHSSLKAECSSTSKSTAKKRSSGKQSQRRR